MDYLWYNFTHFNKGSRVPPPVHFFFLITFLFGITFIFFSDPLGASQTVLYQETTIHIHEWATNLWGVAAVTTCFMMLLAFQIRSRRCAVWGTWLGFVVWLYAGVMYLIGGYLFGVLVAALPNLLFWGWLYFVAQEQYRVEPD